MENSNLETLPTLGRYITTFKIQLFDKFLIHVVNVPKKGYK